MLWDLLKGSFRTHDPPSGQATNRSDDPGNPHGRALFRGECKSRWQIHWTRTNPGNILGSCDPTLFGGWHWPAEVTWKLWRSHGSGEGPKMTRCEDNNIITASFDIDTPSFIGVPLESYHYIDDHGSVSPFLDTFQSVTPIGWPHAKRRCFRCVVELWRTAPRQQRIKQEPRPFTSSTSKFHKSSLALETNIC